VLNFSIPKKKILIFIKYFLEKKSSLSHHITKKNPTPFLQPSHPTPPKNNSLKLKKIPPSYFEKQPNFPLPCHLRNKPLR
jgi:hypothetical protein